MGGVDLVTPAEEFSAGEWLRRAGGWAAALPSDRPFVVVGGTGLYFTALLRGLDAPWRNPPPAYPVLQMDREVRRARIARRIDAMLVAGLEREVAQLHARYPVWSRTAAAAIGYKEFDDAQAGRPVREAIYYRTCQFAKRQDTWFRHQSTPIYVPCGVTDEETASAVRDVWHSHGPWDIAFPDAPASGSQTCHAQKKENVA